MSGGIPPEHFDDLDYASTRRGCQMAVPAPMSDPWGYYVERGQPRQTGAARSSQIPSPEEQIQPHMESSTEATDTNDGQRTTARLLEEVQCLLEALMEPTYTTIDGPMTAVTGGSEAIISDILSAQDPRELTLSEVSERRPAPSEMSWTASRLFQSRHGVRLEDASPTRSMEIIRTPGVAREQEYAERGTYAENVLTLDTRLLQDIISGRWTRQQLYGSTPNWY